MSERVQQVLSAALVTAAVAIGISMVHREFFGGAVAVAQPQGDAPPHFVSDWKNGLESGIEMGDSAGPIKIVEFADLECPVCRRYNEVLHDVIAENPKVVSAMYISFPLPQHRLAMPAARAADCASGLGRFREFIDVVYAQQDSLGLKSWAELAHDAGIADTNKIKACVRNSKPVGRIQAGRAFGERIKLHGTPTIIVNGWQFERPPTKEELTRIIQAIRAGARMPWDTLTNGRKTGS